MARRVLHRVTPYAMELLAAAGAAAGAGAGAEVVLAVRFFYPAPFGPRRFPILSAHLGDLPVLRLATELDDVRAFDESHVAEVVAVGLFVGLAVFAFVLYGLQRGRQEYLWLGLFCLLYALCAVMKIRVESGFVDATTAVILLYRYAGCVAMICSFEFVIHFVHARARWPARVIEASFLLAPLAGQVSEDAFGVWLVALLAALFVYLARYLLAGYRRAVAEVKLLLPFLALLVLGNVIFFVSQF